MLRTVFSTFLMLLIGSTAYAESGKKTTLDWPNPKEKLVYYSCGCADACWVADLQNKSTGVSKIELSCGCETMHLKIKGVETPYLGQCATFEKEDKFDRIVAEIVKIQTQNKTQSKK